MNHHTSRFAVTIAVCSIADRRSVRGSRCAQACSKPVLTCVKFTLHFTSTSTFGIRHHACSRCLTWSQGYVCACRSSGPESQRVLEATCIAAAQQRRTRAYGASGSSSWHCSSPAGSSGRSLEAAASSKRTRTVRFLPLLFAAVLSALCTKQTVRTPHKPFAECVRFTFKLVLQTTSVSGHAYGQTVHALASQQHMRVARIFCVAVQTATPVREPGSLTATATYPMWATMTTSACTRSQSARQWQRSST